MTEPTETDKSAQAREQVDKAAAARAEQVAAQAERANWKPTPTTEECNLVAMGLSVTEVGHAPDGSPPDPNAQARAIWPARRGPDETTREMRPAEPAERGYETR